MAITREKKESVVANLGEGLRSAQSVAFIAFDRLSVYDTQKLRHQLASAGVRYEVVKKTLLGHALSGVSATGTMPALSGNIAVAYSATDATAPAREIYDFAKNYEKGRTDELKLVGGIFEGKYLDVAGINEIATIPSMHVLRGMFVNLINSPIQGFASVIHQIAEKKS